jgi:hypothetical protein
MRHCETHAHSPLAPQSYLEAVLLGALGLGLMFAEITKRSSQPGLFYFFKSTGSAPPRVKRTQLKLVPKQPDPSA